MSCDNDKKKSGVAMLRWDRLHSIENYYKQRGKLHNNNRINLLGRQNYPKCICTKQQNIDINEAKTDRSEMRKTNPKLFLVTSTPHSQQLIEIQD